MITPERLAQIDKLICEVEQQQVPGGDEGEPLAWGDLRSLYWDPQTGCGSLVANCHLIARELLSALKTEQNNQ